MNMWLLILLTCNANRCTSVQAQAYPDQSNCTFVAAAIRKADDTILANMCEALRHKLCPFIAAGISGISQHALWRAYAQDRGADGQGHQIR
jgi:hypothetical protein